MEEPRTRRAVIGVVLSIFLGAMESTVVATAMPKVVGSLGELHMYTWVFSGFLLTSTVTMPLWGRLSDLYGRRPAYLTGLTIFLVGSALSGLSRTMLELILFRMLQGLGAGSLITIGMTIIGDLFRLERRAKMQGMISGVWGVASLVGPLLGGLLTDYVSWRWVFYINLPFGAIAMWLIGSGLPRGRATERTPTIDVAGIALFAVGVSALLLALVQAGRVGTWGSLDVVGLLVVAAVSLGIFVSVEHQAREPMLPLSLFANRIVLAAIVTGFLAGMAMFGAISFVPLFLQRVSGSSATVAGFVLTPFVIGWVVLSALSPRLVLRIGYRPVVFAGMLCLALSFVLLTRWDAALTPAMAMSHMLIAGVGMGLNMVPMLIAVQGAVPRAALGIATSLTQFFRAVGGAIGLSVMGAVMAQRLHGGLSAVEALHGVFMAGLVMCLAAVLAAFLVPPGRAQELARAEPRAAGG
ncbi:MAG TPA: MDR family MFS transporter [Candidatus Acidoferrum sp.]|nr:MDR family MFS transporter [Candidatus Acidoferrum sp.]